MKKILNLFLVISAMAFTTSVMAQLSIGPRVAVNFANVAFEEDDGIDTKNLLGIAFGAAAEIGVSDIFAVQPEVLFSQHGFSFEEDFGGGTVDFDVILNYLQIPLLAKLKFGSDAVVINVLAGPHVGFGIGDITFKADEEKETESWEDTGLQKFDFGITGGVGVSFAAGPGNLGIDIRYQLGLSNLSDDDEDKANNRNLQAGLSYLIPIGN